MGTRGEAPEPPETAGILARGEGASIAYRKRAGSPALPGVVFLGGFRSDLTGTKAAALDRSCAARRQAYLRLDYQGHGGSSGRFEDCTIGTWLGDALAAIDALTEGPQLLVGSSMGGWLALLAALKRPGRIAGLVLLAAAADFTETLIWERLNEAQQGESVAAGVLRRASDDDPAGQAITLALIEEGRRHLLLDAPIPLALPVRLLHGMEDAEVPWRHSLRVAQALAGRDVVLSLVKGGDHRLSKPADLVRLDAAVAELSRRPAFAASRDSSG